MLVNICGGEQNNICDGEPRYFFYLVSGFMRHMSRYPRQQNLRNRNIALHSQVRNLLTETVLQPLSTKKERTLQIYKIFCYV